MNSMNESIKMYNYIKRSKKLTVREKFIISTVIHYQENNMKCKLSNKEIAESLGENERNIKASITKLNKLDFFQSKRDCSHVGDGWYKFGKLMTIDINKLEEFINENQPSISKTK